jgi:hypothetical protein
MESFLLRQHILKDKEKVAGMIVKNYALKNFMLQR